MGFLPPRGTVVIKSAEYVVGTESILHKLIIIIIISVIILLSKGISQRSPPLWGHTERWTSGI